MKRAVAIRSPALQGLFANRKRRKASKSSRIQSNQTEEYHRDEETFLTQVYVIVDDWYQFQYGRGCKRVGRRARMSESEVLTVMLVGQFRVGVAWQTERGLVRWMQTEGKGYFPTRLGRSAFNRRARALWGVWWLAFGRSVGDWLGATEASYECVDGLPLIAMSGGQFQRQRTPWRWASRPGHGGSNGGFFIGDHNGSRHGLRGGECSYQRTLGARSLPERATVRRS